VIREIYDPARGQRVPIRTWARAVSRETELQWLELASQPYVVEHVAAMADAHMSEGVAVGTVFATEHAVVPGALGGDLGCGVAAVKLSIAQDTLESTSLPRLVDALDRAIPTGAALHRGEGVEVPPHLLEAELSTATLEHTREALARRHLGTLGGGNHFVELAVDVDGDVWLLVHSGSRGLGAAIAAQHARAAHSGSARGGPARRPLAALDTRDVEGARYLQDLAWALAFAKANRDALVSRALEVLANETNVDVATEDAIDTHHNFVSIERWFGRELIVHRKGAIAAPEGSRALVPGSMGTASYVVRGLGCASAFGSCSHGAGRVMSRKEARARISRRALESSMGRVAYPSRLGAALVEEAPAAYRDIGQVLRDQPDLARRDTRLEPLLVLKGG